MSAFDFAARGLAARGQARLARSRLVDRLARSIARASTLPYPVPEAAVLPTIGGVAAGLDPAYATPAYWHITDVAALRGPWLGTDYQKPQANAAGGTGFGLLRFFSDAPRLSVGFRTGGSGGFQVRVNGQYIHDGTLALATPDEGYATFPITWGDGTDANRQIRLYEIETYSDIYFAGITTSVTSRVWPAPMADALRMIVNGDSFVEGVAGVTPTAHPPGIGSVIADLCGQPDTTSSGLGGSGFVNPGPFGITFGQRLQSDIIAKAPDVVIEMGGTNDRDAYGSDASQVVAAIDDWTDRLIAALPDVLLFMTGPMSSNDLLNTEAAGLGIAAAKRAACARYPNNAVFIDNLAERWVTGTGFAGHLTGDGNADWVNSGDGVHPTDAGHAYLAQRVVQAMAATLPAL